MLWVAGIGLRILPRTWKLLREAIGVLLEGTPSDVNLAAVRETIVATPGVVALHRRRAWAFTSGANALSARVVVAGGTNHAGGLRAMHGAVMSGHAVAHATLQIESPDLDQALPHA